MGRKPRIHFSGAVYHVMAKGVDGCDIYGDDHDRQYFLDSLRRICRESSVEVLAYCLMGNHYHLALQVSAIPLSSVMQRFQTGYATAFNVRHDRIGHLFHARHRAKLCLDDAYLAVLIRYIHQNPVRAGFVASAGDWPWSSFKQHEADQEALIPKDFDPWAEPKAATTLSRFIDARPLSLEEIGTRVQTLTGVAVAELRSPVRRRPVIAARRALTREAIGNGHALSSIAFWLQTSKASVTRYSQGNTVINGRPDTI
jgi:REP element-mobilizing transposase RayT